MLTHACAGTSAQGGLAPIWPARRGARGRPEDTKGTAGYEPTRFPEKEGARSEADPTERKAMMALRPADIARRAGAPPQGRRPGANTRVPLAVLCATKPYSFRFGFLWKWALQLLVRRVFSALPKFLLNLGNRREPTAEGPILMKGLPA
jgi:hypothetical protein